MTTDDAVREVQIRLCCFQHCTYPNDCHWYGHGKIDRAIEARVREENEACAEMAWSGKHFDNRTLATAIRARIGKEET